MVLILQNNPTSHSLLSNKDLTRRDHKSDSQDPSKYPVTLMDVLNLTGKRAHVLTDLRMLLLRIASISDLAALDQHHRCVATCVFLCLSGRSSIMPLNPRDRAELRRCNTATPYPAPPIARPASRLRLYDFLSRSVVVISVSYYSSI